VLCGGLQPDLTILMISDPASVHRARKREDRKRDAGKSDEGRFEMEAGEFFDRVLKSYLAIAKREPSRMVKVDATQSIAAVHQEIMKAFRKRVLASARNS
jgi:dTMP kinase